MFEVLDECGVWMFCKYLIVLTGVVNVVCIGGDGVWWGLLAPILAILSIASLPMIVCT